MNAQVPATRPEPKAQLVAGGNVAAIIPRSLEETFRLAGAIATSGLAPNTLNTPEKVMVAIIAGAELGMPPFQSLQSFAVINGRPAIWGDGLIAVVRSHGFKVREWLEGEGDDMVAHCEVTRPDSGEVIPGEFSVADAKKAGLWGKSGPWQTSPKRMLKMRARGFACRDGAADVLRGFQLREEVEDYQPIREVSGAPAAAGLAARLAAAAPAAEGFTASQAEQAQDAHFEDAPPAENAQQAQEPRPDGQKLPDGVGPASQVLNTVKARKEAFEAWAAKISAAGLKAARADAKFATLCNDIDAGDPDEVGTAHDLRKWLDDLIDEREQTEREGGVQ